MAVRDTLNKIETLIASASHLPLTGKAIIDEETLLHLIEEFRNELPQELGRAEEVLSERESMLRAAQLEAEKIIKEAKQQAQALVDESDVVIKAREKARMIETQAHQHGNEIVAGARNQARQFQDDVQTYANQVFDQLIANVTNTFNTVQNLNSNFRQALQVLQQSKIALNQQAYNQAQDPYQNYQPNYQQNPQNYPQNYPQNPQNPQNYPPNPQDPNGQNFQ